jgi:cell division protein FtsL
MKKNTKLEKIAKKVLSNIDQKQEDNYGIDPLTLILIIGILLSLIRVIQECRKKRTLLKNKNELAGVIKRDIQELILKDSWFNNLRLKRILKQHLTKDQYRVYGSVLQNNIMEVGVNLTEEEICTLMEAAND